ncbi:ATP-grasp peptide maturase system methyltransferase [Thermopolyspora sp. NPDC052614]|uniref:ATP-grasp peptide maturase system methyltransferase n=1 Tax=Thermopolyspora sp. NPDC052614 TaxID=3155682 RepID=UPI00343EEEF1
MTGIRANESLAARLREGLAERLVESGAIRAPEWRRAVEAVPREKFLGERVYLSRDEGGFTYWEAMTPEGCGNEGWLRLAYSDETLVTQIQEIGRADRHGRISGEPTSSSTLPGLVVSMLEDLRVEDGQRVLEIGTGSGYSTALLCHRLGDDALVTSIDVDPDIAAKAAVALHAAGYRPRLLAGDALTGYLGEGPYDRLIATCSVRHVPQAWIERVRPGGVVLATLSGWLYGSGLARLTVTGAGTAHGNFLPGTVSFMTARAHHAPHLPQPPRDGDRRPARFGADTLNEWMPRWIAQLAVPTASRFTVFDDAGPVTCITDGESSAWLSGSGEAGWSVTQGGRHRLWDRIEAAVQAWRDSGSPSQDRFVLTVAERRQVVSCPEHPALTWALPIIRS